MTRLFGTLFSAVAAALLFGVIAVAALVHYYAQDLPGHQELVEYKPKLLTRVYSGEGKVMAEFYHEKRVFVPIEEVPELVIAAFISAEDKNFYNHPGVDAVGIAKAFTRYAQGKVTGQSVRLAGASTITQQVMKNFLLDNERSFERKIKEAILAVRLEDALSKDDILELYLNEIYLGARSYGIVAAANNYFGKPLEELTAAEAAYLAALPKEPSNLHPIRDRDRALERRDYVLREMQDNGYLPRAEAETAIESPLDTILDDEQVETVTVNDGYFAGEVRRQLVSELGEKEVYQGGLTVLATVDPELQELAARALRRQLLQYDRQRGTYRGPVTTADEIGEDWRKTLARTDAARDIEGWSPAIVLEAGNAAATVGIEATGETAELDLATERKWIARVKRKDGNDIFRTGDVIYVENVSAEGADWRLRQIPEVQGAFMAMDPHSGRVLAIQGGFSHDQSVFNRASQAQRQPGSAFKPFVYSAALDAGYTPATVVLDAPISIQVGNKTWTPKNSSGNYAGPIPLRTALERSKNLVTVRLAQEIGMGRIAEYAERFGVYEDMPHHLAYALGAGETTLYQMVAAYGMFANGGKRLRPTVIDRIQDRHGKTLYRHDNRFCEGCETGAYDPSAEPQLYDTRDQIMDPVTAYQLTSMLKGVVDSGTAASTVGSKLDFDVAGKTGTTNESKDAWFVGYTRNMVAGCFIGFDNPTPMGKGAYGGTLCGPVFAEFMGEAMKTREPGSFEHFQDQQGDQIVMVKIDRLTGERLPDDATGENVIYEAFLSGTEPELYAYNAIRDDNVLFENTAEEDLPYALNELPDTPTTGSGTFNWEGQGGVTVQPNQQQAQQRQQQQWSPPAGGSSERYDQRPSNNSIGLGTGGLY